jgi:hypothetical protein
LPDLLRQGLVRKRGGQFRQQNGAGEVTDAEAQTKPPEGAIQPNRCSAHQQTARDSIHDLAIQGASDVVDRKERIIEVGPEPVQARRPGKHIDRVIVMDSL